jgi:ferrochelatase
MTTIALENLQGWVSADWDASEAKKADDMTKLRAQAMGANN